MSDAAKLIQVAVVDDEDFIPNSMKLAIMLAEDIDWVGHARNAEQGLDMVKRWKPDVVFVDLELHDGVGGIELMRRIHEHSPGIAVVVLTVSDEVPDRNAAFAEGTSGYLVKGQLIDPTDFHGIIRDAAAGRIVAMRETFAPTAADYKSKREKLTPTGESGLSDRELEALELLVDGLRNKEIAERMFLSENTVKHHLGSIYRRLGVNSRQAAVRVAYERGFFPKK